MNKIGRPCKDETKNSQYRLRMSADEMAMLEYIAEKTGKPKSDILRESLKMKYNLVKATY